jgi:mono/diheme cytochrome c family protein
MKRILPRPAAGLFLTVLLTACGDGGEDGKAAKEALTPAERAAALDRGPRAAQALKLDESLAERGANLFEAKSCSDCHTLGEAEIAPDLLEVMEKRTQAWLTMQIIQPEWMSQNDAITRQLVDQYGMDMADLGIPEADVEPILHFLLRESRAAGR